MSKHRLLGQIEYDILKNCQTPIPINKLIRKANISGTSYRRLLTKLIKLRFINLTRINTKKTYKLLHTTTDEGRIYMLHLTDLLELLQK